MKNNPHTSKVLEIFWLIVAIATLIIAGFNIFKLGINNKDNFAFLAMSVAAYLLYIARRNLRRKAQK